MEQNYILALLIFIICAAVVGRFQRGYPLPPGPKSLPIIGNLHQIPRKDPYKVYRDWSEVYGPVIYMRVFGRNFVILNSLKAISDLFEKRSVKYSTRPNSVMGGMLVGREQTAIIFMKYGPKWKQTRQLIHGWMSQRALDRYIPMQSLASYHLLQNLLEDPDHFADHIRNSAGSIILKLTYGLDCKRFNDPWIAMSEEVQRITAIATEPGRWLVDSFPWLRFVPSFLPGAGFLRWAKESRKVAYQLVRSPFDKVKQDLRDGVASSSFVLEQLLQDSGSLKSPEEEEALICAAGSLYAAGIDTIVSTMRMLFYIMARYPEIQRIAQEEIDTVIGSHRLATIQDRESLPYIGYLIKELFRFNAVAHLVPHSLDEDDIYEGYIIPRGTWVIANIWAVLHDASTYKDPEKFNPERFNPSGNGEMDPTYVAFCVGLGRRFCPAYHFSQTTIFLNVTHILSVFNILPPANSNGEDCLPAMEFDVGHIRALRPFNCRVIPRSRDHEELVNHATTMSETSY
ncbi:hypothetical protein M422DRAFT_781573 [Sphaerobolus stellatus SS14]|uniref:Cytochrome P450 n=1 Tax=Sphaerobolus stellatus (strain SS14) TaxID=990650 RepID=A0A0C9USI6_SPHS4|nr:hypothetical protein M422DRAFT_781573 [Sphaerobolus stellatus SS14]